MTQVGSKQKARAGPPHLFVLCNNVAQYVDVVIVNDLGVLVTQHLTFSEHVDGIAQKATYRSYLSPRSSQLTPISLASIHLSEHLRVSTLLLVAFKTRFYRFPFCVT